MQSRNFCFIVFLLQVFFDFGFLSSLAMAFIPVKFCKPYCPIFQSNLSNSLPFSPGRLPINAIQPPQLTNTATRGNCFGPLDCTKNLEVHIPIQRKRFYFLFCSFFG